MGLTAKEEAKRDPVPAGTHRFVCFGVVDLGTQPPLPNSKFSKTEHKVLIQLELPDERIEFERDGVKVEGPRTISKDFTVSLHEKSALRKFLVAWRGRQFTEEELAGFNLDKLLGVCGMVNVVHNAKGYADIASVMPLPKASPKFQAEQPMHKFDLDEHTGLDLPSTLPKFVRERIERSHEWQARIGNDPQHDEAPPPHEDDEIPFD